MAVTTDAPLGEVIFLLMNARDAIERGGFTNNGWARDKDGKSISCTADEAVTFGLMGAICRFRAGVPVSKAAARYLYRFALERNPYIIGDEFMNEFYHLNIYGQRSYKEDVLSLFDQTLAAIQREAQNADQPSSVTVADLSHVPHERPDRPDDSVANSDAGGSPYPDAGERTSAYN